LHGFSKRPGQIHWFMRSVTIWVMPTAEIKDKRRRAFQGDSKDIQPVGDGRGPIAEAMLLS